MSDSSEVSHIAMRVAIVGIEAVLPRQNAPDLALQRPVDVLDAAGPRVENRRQLRDDAVVAARR